MVSRNDRCSGLPVSLDEPADPQDDHHDPERREGGTTGPRGCAAGRSRGLLHRDDLRPVDRSSAPRRPPRRCFALTGARARRPIASRDVSHAFQRGRPGGGRTLPARGVRQDPRGRRSSGPATARRAANWHATRRRQKSIRGALRAAAGTTPRASRRGRAPPRQRRSGRASARLDTAHHVRPTSSRPHCSRSERPVGGHRETAAGSAAAGLP